MYNFSISAIVTNTIGAFTSLYNYFFEKESVILHLPLQKLGLKNIPAVPVDLPELPKTLLRLSNRQKEAKQAKAGLSREYTIQGVTDNAYSFAFEKEEIPFVGEHQLTQELQKAIQSMSLQTFVELNNIEKRLKNSHENANFSNFSDNQNPLLTSLSLDKPEQFSLAWTTFGNLYKNASKELLPFWAKSLTNAEEATQQFWAIVSQYSAAYNLLVVKKVDAENYAIFKNQFSTYWNEEIETIYQSKCLYIIDLTIYENIQPQTSEGAIRFTPATFTFLKQDIQTKNITPFAVVVSGYQGENRTFFEYKKSTDSTWIYALQAAKTSLTVYGIWFGHVYHWHIVNAAMTMTMFNNIPENHALYSILAPQSKYTIGFNESLLLLWKVIAPPTSITTSYQFLELINIFAKDRNFFDDDPKATLQRMGLKKEDFSDKKDWDKYPVIAYYLQIWDIVEEYATAFVMHTYQNNNAVIADSHLQNWINSSSNTNGGNVRGLPLMDNRESLLKVLTSLLYRKTVHGIPNLENSLMPSMTFVANYPPCLHSSLIPSPQSTLAIKDLLEYLPKTGIIGEMISFYYTFIYTTPYEPFIPLEGVDENLFFGKDIESPLNKALIKFRNDMVQFMKNYTLENSFAGLPVQETQINQWSLSVEV